MIVRLQITVIDPTWSPKIGGTVLGHNKPKVVEVDDGSEQYKSLKNAEQKHLVSLKRL